MAVANTDWTALFRERLPVYGHRNWIAVLDAAYPAQCRPGIETVVTQSSLLPVLRSVMSGISAAPHVRPCILLAHELNVVSEADAPGIARYREELSKLLGNAPVEWLAHEQIIARLDKTAAMFNVLALKTDMTLPYTSVFIDLECGYWSDAAEQRLRAAMPTGQP